MSNAHTSCIFCKIIAREIPSAIVAENERILVIKDISPKAPIHYLIIPKVHVADVISLELEHAPFISDMFFMARDIGSRIAEPHFRLVTNNGSKAGQSVFHLHLHFLAGKQMTDL